MIVIRLMGGLGNQMFQYALGRRLAYGRGVNLKLDLSWFQSQTLRRYMLDRLNISAEIASTEEVARIAKSNVGGLAGRAYQAIQRRLPYYRRSVVGEPSFAFDRRIFNVGRDVLLTGYWQSEKYFAPIASLLREEFTLRETLSLEGQAWEEKISRTQSVSLHVRRGDYMENSQANQFHGVCSLEYYDQAISHIRQKFPYATLFVFSDDMDWARQNLEEYSPVEFVEIKNTNRDSEELMLMNLCNHHIIANSSYSWWGAWLGTSLGKIVVAPQKWFNDGDRNIKDLIPEQWVRL